VRIRDLLVILLISAISFSCAKQGSPMGGPKDLDPPQAIDIIPKDQSLNVKPTRIVLTFNEYVKLDNATKNIIITPKIDKDKAVITAVKDQVIIEFNQQLEDSTTYVINFQKSVQDISEENPAENLKLVFSTGTTIDSLKFSGHVNTYFLSKRSKITDAIVGLYPLDDTTNVFIASPYYLTQVDSSGNFLITNIKKGKYKAYAWSDDNNSLKAEYKSEAFDFISDTILIENDIESVTFNLSKGDQTPIKLLRSSPSNSQYSIVLNRPAKDIEIKNDLLGSSIFYTTEDKKINLYPAKPISDSLQLFLSLSDSVGFSIDTAVWAKFELSDRKAPKLSVTANSGLSFYQNLSIELKFNKPIEDINLDSLYLSYDTASVIPISRSMLSFADSLRRDVVSINLTVPDSIPFEVISLNARDSTFIDMEGEYNETILKANYKKLKRETLADNISGTIIGTEGPFIVQLLDSKGEMRREEYVETGNKFNFKLIEATNYQIQVIVDKNGNRRWDPANFSQNRLAEPVFYYLNEENGTSIITIRGGWTVEDLEIQASKESGLERRK